MSETIWDTVYSTAVGAIAGVGTTAATAGGMSALGFSSAGVVAGSTAAVAQAGIGNVVAGSAFAVAQSVAATGVVATVGPVAVGVGAVGGLAYGVSQYFFWFYISLLINNYNLHIYKRKVQVELIKT